MRSVRFAGSLFIVLSWVAFSSPSLATIIAVTDALVADGNLGASSGAAITTADGTGLGAGYPTFPDTHSGFNTTGYLSAAGNSSGSLHYDFGAQASFDTIRFWNYHGLGTTTRGAFSVSIWGSNDPLAYGDEAGPWQSITSVSLAQAPANGDTAAYGEEFDLAAFSPNYRYVRLFLEDNHGATEVGLAEVQFISSVPEPSALALLGILLPSLKLARRHEAGTGSRRC
ncbi:MAG: PEP-CTERM sorting domain-containing protein [bacterium]|nr:PEP-CTERM sorting domain-containing protein [bacterium]